MSTVIRKYLLGHAEPEIQALSDLPARPAYQQVLVIPACNESPDFLQRLPVTGDRNLLVLVINQSAQAPVPVRIHNQALTGSARALGKTVWTASKPSPMELVRNNDQSWDFLLVDRFSEGLELPIEGGVGHARKLGADLALALIDRGQITSSWIHNTDADTELPVSYFESGQDQQQEAAAVLFPFKHRCDPGTALGRATRLYEFSLFYYVAGLNWAGSPYAFQTVGSSFAVHADRYAQVRGFPKRVAAEDFYMLNKLAKVAAIEKLDCQPISIQARTSDRVPFGTGAAVGHMLNMQDAISDYPLYDPRVFSCLRNTLGALGTVWQSASGSRASLMDGIDSRDASPLPAEQLVETLCSLGWLRALEHGFRQSADSLQFERQIHAWFDAFRTLKLIHRLRDDFFPSMPLTELRSQPCYHPIVAQHPGLALAYPELTP